jgi:hypothetical protein
LRHPSYFGWFWWSIGTQILLQNPLSVVAYSYASWSFFKGRIEYEERTLCAQFPGEYEKNAKRVPKAQGDLPTKQEERKPQDSTTSSATVDASSFSAASFSSSGNSTALNNLSELLLHRQDEELVLSDGGLACLQRQCDLNLVSVFGPARQGKSFLINLLQCGSSFDVSSKAQACTKGAHISTNFMPLSEFSENSEAGPTKVVGFIDVEGQVMTHAASICVANSARVVCRVIVI